MSNPRDGWFDSAARDSARSLILKRQEMILEMEVKVLAVCTCMQFNKNSAFNREDGGETPRHTHASLAQWQSIRLLTEGSWFRSPQLVRLYSTMVVQPSSKRQIQVQFLVEARYLFRDSLPLIRRNSYLRQPLQFNGRTTDF